MKRRRGKKIKLGKVEVSEQLLHDSIMELMDAEDAMLEEEMKQAQPHVFSKEFEQKMEEVMRVQERVCKRSNVIRYVASAAVVVLLIFGLLFVGNEDLRASKFKMDVLEWMEEFFVVENDTNCEQNGENDVLFHESQIGYIPEGFEKVFEEVQFSQASYRYQNDGGEYIVLFVYRDKAFAGVDNKDSSQDVEVNETGFEYRYVYKEESKEHIYSWTDKENKFYILNGLTELAEVQKFIEGISY